MTKSQGFSTHRRAFIKSVRAKSHREGTSFRKTLEDVSGTNAAKKALMHVDNLGSCEPRNVRRQWYSDALTVDDGNYDQDLRDVYDFKIDFSDEDTSKHQTDMTVHLLEIARPTQKRKGAARDFEVIKKSRPTALGDEEFEIWDDDDEFEVWEDEWEKIYDEERVDTRKSYSSVLRGNDR